MLDETHSSDEPENQIKIINSEFKCSKKKCKFYAGCLGHLSSSIEDMKRMPVYRMLKRILLRYRDSLENFEKLSEDRIKYYKMKLKEAEMQIEVQEAQLKAASSNITTQEGKELFDILSKSILIISYI